MPYTLERRLPNTVIYLLTPNAGEINLLAYSIVGNQPFVVGLYGFGSYSDKKTLIGDGLFQDFITMAASVASSGDTVNIIDPPLIEASGDQGLPSLPEFSMQPSSSADSPTPQYRAFASVTRTTSGQEGGYHCHGSVCGYDISWLMLTRWDSAIREVQRLYEEMSYLHSAQRGYTLYRTIVTDRSNYCSSGDPSPYLLRQINKKTSAASPKVIDDWYPAYRNANIGAQTYHMTVFGDQGLILYCVNNYQPFY